VTTLFLPLRSNCGWFASEDTHAELARRLKSWLLFYDVIAPEDGRYRAFYTERGSFDWDLGVGAIDDRTQIRYYEPESDFAILVAAEETGPFHSLLRGPAFARYEVDFFPLLHEAGITSAEYVRWISDDLTDEAKLIAKKSASAAIRAAEEDEAPASPNRWLASKIVQNLHRDAFLAGALDLPMSVDVQAGAVVSKSNELVGSEWAREATSVLQEGWLSLGLPDPSREPWDVILELRESAGGKDFRRVIAHLSQFASEVLSGGGSSEDFAEEARKLLVGELLAELLRRRASPGEAVINLALNLIPYASTALGTANDVRKVVREHQSWVAVLDKLGHGGFRPI